MLPHIDGQQWLHIMRNRRVGVMQRRSFKRFAIKDQPCPAAGKMSRSFLFELGQHVCMAAETCVDHGF